MREPELEPARSRTAIGGSLKRVVSYDAYEDVEWAVKELTRGAISEGYGGTSVCYSTLRSAIRRILHAERTNKMTTTIERKTRAAVVGAAPCSAQELFDKAFSGHRSPRSPEYKAGVLAHLRFALKECGIHNPYKEGTAQSDAWYAGVQESWLILQANGISPND